MKIEILSQEGEIDDTARVLSQVEAGRPVTRRDRLTFRTLDDLRTLLTSERIRLLRVIRRQEPGSVYELARLAGRDRKSVTTDLQLLARLGLVRLKTDASGPRRRQVPHVTFSRIEIAVDV